MNNRSIVWHIILLGIILGFSPAAGYGQPLSQIREMETVVQAVSAEEFFQQITEGQWICPRIPSRWHVEQIAAEDERPVLLAARTFGARLLERVQDWRNVLIAMDSTPEDLFQRADALTHLADWLIATPGYGNLLLAARCDDLASVGVGRLLINLDFPMERIAPLLETLDLAYNAPSFRREVLNQEAGAALFPSLPDETEMLVLFEEIWHTGQQGRILYTEAEIASMPQHAEMFRQVKHTLPMLRAHAAFFHDDDLPESRTTIAIWEYKWHRYIVAGMRSQNIRRIQALGTFRQVVGDFPEKPVLVLTEEEREDHEKLVRLHEEAGIHLGSYESAFLSPREAGFNYEWNRLKPSGADHRVGKSAWKVYEELLAGTFLDEDARKEASLTPRTR